jgi:hypothetical protein
MGASMIFPLGRQSKLKNLLKGLQIEIAAEALKFSSDVQSQYAEKISAMNEELCAGESSSSEPNQMILNLGALSLFVHALDRVSFRPGSEKLRETILDDTALELSRLHRLHRSPRRASGTGSLGGGRRWRAPRGREDREGTDHRLLGQDCRTEPTTRHVQRQQLRPARVALPRNGTRRIRAGAFGASVL